MRNRVVLIMAVLCATLSACVQLPNLLPNGSGSNSDMVIIELNTLIGDPIVVNDSLTIEFGLHPDFDACPSTYFKVVNGNVLTDNNQNPVILDEGDLVGGFVDGYWKGRGFLSYGQLFISGCLYLPSFEFNQDSVIGIRFNVNGKTHYGWAIFNADSNSIITLKTVGYNKLPGVNVRIGE